MDIVTYALSKKLVNGIQSGLASATVDNDNCSITFNWTNGTSSTMTFPKPADGAKGDKGDTGISVQDIKIQEISGVRHLIVTLDDSTEIDAGVLPNEQYDDTAIKADIKTNADNIATNTSDISDLQSDKQDKTDNSLDTTDKTVVGAINEVNGNLLDTVGFSADYKNIILNRKSGLNPYIIPISAIINNAKLVELGDVDDTDIGNGKTLIYDGTTSKHKYVDSAGTDELVKMEASTDAKYLSDLIDKSTIVNDNGTLKVKKLDGQDVTITEINYLKGLTMNVMDLVNMFSNGGVKIINTPVATYADLLTYDKSALIDGISYLIYVLADETHDGAKTTYLIDTVTTTPTYFGFAGEHRDFTTSPIDLASEVTGKLPTSNIDVDNLWTLLTINDTYKTLTTNDEVFGTHGAKALYDELVTAIGAKANDSDLTAHTGDTDIHVTTTDKDKWNKVTDKVDTTDFETHTGDTDIHVTADKQTKWDKTSTDFTTHSEDTDIHTSATEKASYALKEKITDTINSSSTSDDIASAKGVYNNVISKHELKEFKVNFGETSDLTKIGISDYTTLTSLLDITKTLGRNYRLVMQVNGTNKQTLFDNGIIPYNDSGLLIITVQSIRGSAIYTTDGNLTYATTTSNAINTEWKAWNQLCTTTVKDVAKTNITLPTISGLNVNVSELWYTIKNGWCNVNFYLGASSPAFLDWTDLTTALPKPYFMVTDSLKPDFSTSPNILLQILDGKLKIMCSEAIPQQTTYYCNLSYPVADS